MDQTYQNFTKKSENELAMFEKSNDLKSSNFEKIEEEEEDFQTNGLSHEQRNIV